MTFREEVEQSYGSSSKQFMADHPVLYPVIFYSINAIQSPRFWIKGAILKFNVFRLKRKAIRAIANGRFDEIPQIISEMKQL